MDPLTFMSDHVLSQIRKIIIFTYQMTGTLFLIQKKIVALQNTFMIKGDQDPVLLFEAL